MALDRSRIVSLTRDRLYSTGIGNKPSIRQSGAAVPSAVNADGTAVFAMASAAEAAKVKAGHILSVYSSTDADDAYAFYVLDVTDDDVTVVNGYQGAAITISDQVPLLLEHQPPVTLHRIQEAIEDIIEVYLWPEVYEIAQNSLTPNMNSGQSAAAAGEMEILRAWQQLAGRTYQVPCKIVDDMPTGLYANGKMIQYATPYAGTLYYSVYQKIDLTSTGAEYEDLIARGAAALVLEGADAASHWEHAKNDSKERQRLEAQMPHWSSFYQKRREMSNALALRTNKDFVVERG